MRLIDADKIYQILENKSSYGYVSALDISSIEIVKAIPVEWIKKYIENQYIEGHHYSKFIIEELAGYGNNFYYDKARHIREMLTEWRKVEEAEDE